MNIAAKIMLSLLLTFDLANASSGNRTTLTTKDPQIRTNDAKCADDYKFFEQKCYRVVHIDIYFERAREHCHGEKAELVSVGSERENSFVSKLLEGHDEAWIGYKKINDEYQWMDKSDATYENWMRSKPSGSGKCTEMIPGGEWVNILCLNKISFVCKKDPIPLVPKDNLRGILAIAIPAAFVFIMFVFVTFLCIKSHKELEAVESQLKETIPFEIVKAAMVLPMSKPPDLLDQKVDEWRGRIKSISMNRSDIDLRMSTYSTEKTVDDGSGVHLKPYGPAEASKIAGKNSAKLNIMHFLNKRYAKERGPSSNLSLTKSQPDPDHTPMESVTKDDNLSAQSLPALYKMNNSISSKESPTSETNYISKVGKWLTESPESPIRGELSGSDRRKNYKKSRGSLNYSTQRGDDPSSSSIIACNADNLNKNKKNVVERDSTRNMISVVADVNVPRNISSDIDENIPHNTSSDIEINRTSSATSSTHSSKSIETNEEKCGEINHKTRKKAVVSPPREEVRNGNFLFLKTINPSSQETASTDLCETSIENDEKPLGDSLEVTIVDATEREIVETYNPKKDYQLVTFV